MLANFFGKSKPVNFILIIVLFLSYYVLDLFIYNSIEFKLEYLIALPLFLGVFFLYNFIISKNKLTYDNSYAFLLFVVGIGFLPSLNVDYSELINYLLLLLFFRKVYSLRTLKTIYSKLFDSGFWLGILFLFAPQYLLYVLLMYVSVLLFLKITFRTIIIPLIGVLIPVFLFFTYHMYNETLEVFYSLFNVDFKFDFENTSSNYYILLFSFFGIFSLISIVLKSGKIFSVSNKFKKSWTLLIVHLFLAVGFIVLKPIKNGSELISFLIPASIIITNWLQTVKKKVIVNLVLLIFLVTSFIIHFII